MSQGIADAANGTGEAKDALEELGLSAEDLQRKGPEKAFEEIIAKLDEIPNGIKKTNLAMDLFGRSGASMTNLTSGGLQQAQKDADALGLKLSSAQAGGVEAANDAWAKIKNAAGDFLKYITASMAPKVEAAFGRMFEILKKQDLKAWADGIVSAMVAVGKGILQAIPTALLVVLTGVNLITKAFTGWKLVWAELRYNFAGFMEFLWSGLNNVRNGVTALLEAANVGGIFDEQLANSKRIASEQQTILAQIRAEQKQALQDEKDAILTQQQTDIKHDQYAEQIGSVENGIDQLINGAAERIEASKQVTAAVTSDLDTEGAKVDALRAKYEALNNVKLSGGGTYNTASFGLSDLADSLEDGDL